MTNNDMLANIEYLREKADVSYEEAERLLEQFDGNVMRALVELERQGRVYGQAPIGESQQGGKGGDGMKRAKEIVHKAMRTRLIVEKKAGDTQETIASVPAPFAVLFAVSAPWLTVATIGVGAVTGHTVRIEKAAREAEQENG